MDACCRIYWYNPAPVGLITESSMKIFLLSAFFALMAGYTHGQIIAAGSLDVPTIVVTGKAEIAVEPDYALISVHFSKTDKDLQVAQKSSEGGVFKVLELSRKYSIPASDVSTDAISVSMRYLFLRDPSKRIFNDSGDEIGVRTFDGYEVARTVSIKLSDLAKFQQLFNEILKTEPSEIDHVSFETSRVRELKDKTRELAMVAAREKALAMTHAIGQTLGKALKITEGSNESSYLNSSNSMLSHTSIRAEPTVHLVSQSLTSFSPGTVKVEATVTVVFKLD